MTAGADDVFGEADEGGVLPALASGARVGPYRVVKYLGYYDAVERYEARHRLGRTHELNLIPVALNFGIRYVEQLKQEVAVRSRVRHSHVVRVFHAGSHGSHRRLWLSLERTPGAGLREWLAKNGAFEPEAAMRLCAQVARGVLALEPCLPAPLRLVRGNVHIVNSTTAKVTDRLASNASASMGAQSLADNWYFSVHGVPGLGEGPRDQVVFRLGLILFEMVSGRPLFDRGADASAFRNWRDFRGSTEFGKAVAVLDHFLAPDASARPLLKAVPSVLHGKGLTLLESPASRIHGESSETHPVQPEPALDSFAWTLPKRDE